MVFTTAGGSLSSVSHPGTIRGDSTILDTGARGCPLSEKGDPSSEEFAKEGLSRGALVRGTKSDWASMLSLAKGEGDWGVEAARRSPPYLPSWDPGEKETASFLRFWSLCNRTKRKQKILRPALLRGKEWCGNHLLKSKIQELLRPAPHCSRCEGCCWRWTGAEVEATRGCPGWQADGGAAAGGWLETAEDRWGRMC